MKAKSIFMTIMILFIGFVIGVLAGGKFTMHKIHKARDMHTERGIMKHVFESLELEEVTKDSVKVIMEDFARLDQQRHEVLQQEMHDAHLNLEKSLSKYLSEIELRRLRRIMRHRKPKPPRDGREMRHHRPKLPRNRR